LSALLKPSVDHFITWDAAFLESTWEGDGGSEALLARCGSVDRDGAANASTKKRDACVVER
tara:strand:+ start:659 stop:841 length:183 start_codon:yes stop_codon:yes gene_type:complete